MNNERRKRLKANQAQRRKHRPLRAVDADSTEESAVERGPSPVKANIQHEMDYIVERALENVATCVTLGPLAFFSTDTGDAWMLDVEDGLALCLALDGEPQPVRVFDTDTQTGVQWDREFSIDQDAFITWDMGSGKETAILGYPTRVLLDAIDRARKLWQESD